MWLVPPVALEELAWVLKLGADKYGEYNWRKTGVCASTYISAAFRHLNAWRDGEDLDPESSRSHLAHAMTCFAIVLDAEKCGTLDDDRNKLPVPTQKKGGFFVEDEAILIPYPCYNFGPTFMDPHGVFAEPTTPAPEGYVFDEDAPKYDFTGERVVEIPAKVDDGACVCGHRLVRDHKGNDICENCENHYNL
jgi:hypothetical protein